MNIYDIAEEAGVSPATVSRVLNNKTNVKESTRQKVLEIIEGKQYQPNMMARNLSNGVSRNIAFLVPDIENDFFAKVLHGISDCAFENQYNVFMFGTDENVEQEHRILMNLQSEMVRGMIITPVDENDKESARLLKVLEKRGIPVVLVDRDIHGVKLDGVFSNDVDGAAEAVQYLIDGGHRKIGIISGPESSRPGLTRLNGYKKALLDNNIEIRDEYIIKGDFREKDAYFGMEKLMQLPDPPTAVFTSNNLYTIGCLKYMKKNGLKLVKDIDVVGFDDIKALECTDLDISVVDRPVYEMGYEAMRLLKKRFDDTSDTDKKRPTRRYMVDTWLVYRGKDE